MKKIICYVFSIILSLAFAFLAVTLTTLFLDPSILENEILFGVLLGMCVSILLIEMLNGIYDKADGYVSKRRYFGRWVHNCCFLSLLICFAYALLYTLVRSESLGIDHTTLYLLVFFVLIGVYLYFLNYRSLMSRKARIKAVTKRQLRYKNRRYYYLVDEVKDEEKWMKLSGKLHGSIHVKDEVYIYVPEEDSIKANIVKLSVKGESVSKAKDGNIEICLKKDEQTKTIHKYSVISSVEEKVEMTEENLVENPSLNGLIMGYGKWNHDPNYMSVLLWEISSAEYLMAGRCNEKLDGEITDVLKRNVSAAFPSVSTAMNEKLSILPIFTDWDALNRWKLMMEDKDAMSVIMKYEQIAEIMHTEFDGIVINPFGPFPFYLPNDLANSLLKMHQEAKDEE